LQLGGDRREGLDASGRVLHYLSGDDLGGRQRSRVRERLVHDVRPDVEVETRTLSELLVAVALELRGLGPLRALTRAVGLDERL
jgi:hypothetical protein